MRIFVIELARAVMVFWAKTWRRVVRSRRNFFVFLGILVSAFLVWSVGSVVANPPTAKTAVSQESEPTEIPIEYAEVTAVPVAPGEGATAGAQAAPQGEGQEQETEAPSVVPQGALGKPEQPKVNPRDTDSVAKGFVGAYVNRPSQDWQDWKGWVDGYATSELVAQLSKSDPLADSTLNFPVQVQSVEISPAKGGSAMDTPVRWSRTVTVALKGEDGNKDSISYSVMLSQGEKGWVVTEVIKDSK